MCKDVDDRLCVFLVCRAAKAKMQRLERQTKEMEKQMEAYRHSQAKVSELERTNKKLYDQTHADRKEIIRLKEEMQSYKNKVRELANYSYLPVRELANYSYFPVHDYMHEHAWALRPASLKDRTPLSSPTQER